MFSSHRIGQDNNNLTAGTPIWLPCRHVKKSYFLFSACCTIKWVSHFKQSHGCTPDWLVHNLGQNNITPSRHLFLTYTIYEIVLVFIESGETPAISPPAYFQFRFAKPRAFNVRIDSCLKPKYRNTNHFPVRSGATYISLFLWFELSCIQDM